MSNQAVEIQVYGRSFKVNCPAGQEDALRAAAADFDQRLKDLSERTKITNAEQLLMFTGLNICNELHSERQEQQRNAEKLSNRISEMEDLLEKALQYQPKR
ncbi:cell division protein ZapA [Photobacterium sp. DNB23_23_1]|uniref:Cell division protein ZapA n=1 Tax=Photobacterium pectinilyticum TaxID=2906793 RepID=A0ABT1MYG8_9GAMM|nr:cell division protein ZapA [Photobacterium sp. ZSDE20]MCQ1057541.1 cell division protein ZapA [Photobacterium sp. ZSDE20]MDD1821883.1 cell division protein ZapA [Photobacterium sp. ZSDE20]